MQTQDKDKILACLLKRIRVDRDYSTIDISKRIHVTQQYISEIEKGRKAMNLSLFNEAIELFNIHFDADIDYTQVDNLIDGCIAIFLYKPELLSEHLKEIISSDKYKYSYYYKIHILLEYIYYSLFGEFKDWNKELIIGQIRTLEKTYTNKEILFFYASYLLESVKSRNVVFDEFESILFKTNLMKIDEDNELECGLYASIIFLTSSLYETKMKMLNLMDALKESRNYFKKALMFNGYLYSQTYLANCYSVLDKEIESNQILSRTKTIASALNEKEVIEFIDYQYATKDMLKSNYEGAIDKLLQFKDKKGFNRHKLLLCIIYMSIEKRQDAKKVLLSVNSESLTNVSEKVYNKLKTTLNDNLDFTELFDLVNCNNVFLIMSDRIVVLNILIDYCKEHEIDCSEQEMLLRSIKFSL